MSYVKFLLIPFSLLYGLGVSIRNFLFHTGILKSRTFNVPVICVGNITVGGTGKTPHTELLIAELQKEFRVACLSRGYKRKTSGFILARPNSSAAEIGDEPLQIKMKFPEIIVACDEKRVRGIERLLALPEKPDVIILDDAFQHRYVKPGKSIVLMDYHRPVYKDYLLPAGRLRESRNGLRRADFVIVSKCPANIQPIEKRIIYKSLKIKPYQQLYFTTTTYGQAQPLFPDAPSPVLKKESRILCLTGIARPEPYIAHLRSYTECVTELRYPDHHAFSQRDITQISAAFNKISGTDSYIFTTEKDAVRLRAIALPESIRNRIYYIPIEPVFLNKKETFVEEIRAYVRKNKK